MTSRASLWDRRTLIRTFGLAGASAWALMRLRPEPARAQGATPPRRVVFFYVPNGIFHDLWRPKAAWQGAEAGKSADLPLAQVAFGDKRNVLGPLFTETPFASIRDDLLILDGLSMQSARDAGRGDDHGRGVYASMSGCTSDTGANDFEGGPVSLDRFLASRLLSPLPGGVISSAMQLEIFGGTGGYDGIFHGAGGGDHHKTPSSAWQRLFGDRPTSGPAPQGRPEDERQADILFQKEQEIARLRDLLGKDEQLVLEEHLAAIRTYKQGLANQSKVVDGCRELPRPGDAAWVQARYDHLERIGDAYADLLVNGFLCDRLRIATLLWLNSVTNNMHCKWLGPNYTYSYHHNISHHGEPNGDADKRVGDYIPPERIDDVRETAYRFFVRQFGKLLVKLKNAKPGGRPLLDSTSVVWVTEMCDGQHRFDVPGPFFMGGGGGVRADGKTHFRTGRYVKFAGRQHNDLLVSVAHAMGLEQARTRAGAMRELDHYGARAHCKGALPGLRNT